MVHQLRPRVKHFLAGEAGPTSTEYAVLLALIIVVAVAGVTLLGTKLNQVFTNADSVINPGTAGAFGTTT